MRVKDILFHLKKFPKKGELVLKSLTEKKAEPKKSSKVTESAGE